MVRVGRVNCEDLVRICGGIKMVLLIPILPAGLLFVNIVI